jgi:hypothetical protein
MALAKGGAVVTKEQGHTPHPIASLNWKYAADCRLLSSYCLSYNIILLELHEVLLPTLISKTKGLEGVNIIPISLLSSTAHFVFSPRPQPLEHFAIIDPHSE